MTTHQVDGRPWDSFDAYLFDIDGTLVNCTDAVHYFAFCEALQTLSGRPLNLDGVVAHGNVDTGILRDALVLAGTPESIWRPQLPAVTAGIGDFVAARSNDLRPNILPQVVTILDHLRGKGATLGVATGNLRRVGESKLERAEILHYFHIGGWSDGFEYRPDVIRAAVAKVRAATHPDATICILGDTPADIVAAHANGIPVIAVATGIYTRDQLLAENPELCLQSFADLF